jgi:hypothetical protein
MPLGDNLALILDGVGRACAKLGLAVVTAHAKSRTRQADPSSRRPSEVFGKERLNFLSRVSLVTDSAGTLAGESRQVWVRAVGAARCGHPEVVSAPDDFGEDRTAGKGQRSDEKR